MYKKVNSIIIKNKTYLFFIKWTLNIQFITQTEKVINIFNHCNTSVIILELKIVKKSWKIKASSINVHFMEKCKQIVVEKHSHVLLRNIFRYSRPDPVMCTIVNWFDTTKLYWLNSIVACKWYLVMKWMDGFPYNLAQVFSITRRCVVRKNHAPILKVKVTQAV